jgi:hypothetical protein
LVGWLVGFSVGWLVGWLVGWFFGRLVGWLVGWFFGRLVGWFFGRSVRCLAISVICDVQTHKHSEKFQNPSLNVLKETIFLLLLIKKYFCNKPILSRHSQFMPTLTQRLDSIIVTTTYICGFIGSVLLERTRHVVAFKCVEMVTACLRFIPEFAGSCCKNPQTKPITCFTVENRTCSFLMNNKLIAY